MPMQRRERNPSKTEPARKRKAVHTLQGVRIGHATDRRGVTGCTVVLVEGGAVCGADVRGSASTTRDLAPCLTGHVVDRVHAVFLTGGSAFGIDAAAGVMRFLESKQAGFPTGHAVVPIVPGAVIYDLGIGSARAWPGAKMALLACRNASDTPAEGSVGAGTGATVGKLFGVARSTKSGVGFQEVILAGKVVVQALVVVNAFGDIIDPSTGRIVAGARVTRQSREFTNSAEKMMEGEFRRSFSATNTTLAVVMTDAALDRVQAVKVAQMAHDGMARAISPAHTMFDGDVVFALSVGKKRADVNNIGAAAAEATARAIVSAVLSAKSLGGIPAFSDFSRRPPVVRGSGAEKD